MVCPYCGNPNPEASPFCAYCGRPLSVAPPASPVPQALASASPHRQSVSAPHPTQKKRRKGLIAVLVVGGVLLAAVIAVLLLVLLPGDSVKGWWYNEKEGVALAFFGDGTAQYCAPEGLIKAEYEFRGGKGTLEMDGREYDFTVDGDRMKLETEEDITLRKAGESFDASTYLAVAATTDATSSAGNTVSENAGAPFDILGDWYEVQAESRLSFSEDAVTLESIYGAVLLEGSYSFDPATGAGSLTLDFKGQPIQADFHIARFDWCDYDCLFIGDEWYSKDYRESFISFFEEWPDDTDWSIEYYDFNW